MIWILPSLVPTKIACGALNQDYKIPRLFPKVTGKVQQVGSSGQCSRCERASRRRPLQVQPCSAKLHAQHRFIKRTAHIFRISKLREWAVPVPEDWNVLQESLKDMCHHLACDEKVFVADDQDKSKAWSIDKNEVAPFIIA